MRKNMQRLRRGELSRIKPQKAPHTDVHMGPPMGQQAQEDVGVEKLQKKVVELRAKNEELQVVKAEAEKLADMRSRWEKDQEAINEKIEGLERRNAELEGKLEEALDGEGQDDQVDKLKEELEAVKGKHQETQAELLRQLDGAKAENAKLVADREELEKQLAERAELEPVTGLRVLKVLEVNETDELMRIDCEFKPTSGPLGSTGAIVLPSSEVDKLLGED